MSKAVLSEREIHIMTLSDMIVEYEQRIAEVAEKNWLQVLFAHTLFDNQLMKSYTWWLSTVVFKWDVADILENQIDFIEKEFV